MLCLPDYDWETLCRILTVLGSTASLLPSAVIRTLKGKTGHSEDCLPSSVLWSLKRSSKKYTVKKDYLASVGF